MYITGMTVMTMTFEALAEPSRRELLDAVRDTELSVSDLVDIVGLSQPGVSRHLRILREAGLVTVRTQAQRRLYRAQPDALLGLDEWLAPYRRYWSIRLDALGDHLHD
jgi:DNA-binding transcriptional ArsR family regulator